MLGRVSLPRPVRAKEEASQRRKSSRRVEDEMRIHESTDTGEVRSSELCVTRGINVR